MSVQAMKSYGWSRCFAMFKYLPWTSYILLNELEISLTENTFTYFSNLSPHDNVNAEVSQDLVRRKNHKCSAETFYVYMASIGALHRCKPYSMNFLFSHVISCNINIHWFVDIWKWTIHRLVRCCCGTHCTVQFNGARSLASHHSLWFTAKWNE